MTAIQYCIKCKIFKPVRAKHCKICQKCIYRFDHHCQWIGNCVGKNNHKHFIQFLFYSAFTLLFFSIFQVRLIQSFCFFVILKNKFVVNVNILNIEQVIGRPEDTYVVTLNVDIAIKFVCIFSLILALILVYLFFYQIRNLRQNLTTIEQIILSKVGGSSPFDAGSERYCFKIINKKIKNSQVFELIY